MKKEPTNQAEIRHPSCQCCICEEMRLLEAQEAGKDYTAPPPNETNVGHPDALAGHRGDGGGAIRGTCPNLTFGGDHARPLPLDITPRRLCW